MRVNSPKSNEPISNILIEIANYLVLEKENPYKILSFRKASLIVKSLPFDISRMEQLTSIKGIGDSLSLIIGEILNTGTCHLVERLRKKYVEKKTNGKAR